MNRMKIFRVKSRKGKSVQKQEWDSRFTSPSKENMAQMNIKKMKKANIKIMDITSKYFTKAPQHVRNDSSISNKSQEVIQKKEEESRLQNSKIMCNS
mmetsp:Transcript_4473/g.4198  ORF Transcript_4473/g.4198 Transcript_4473/m.4198 type:complete len:97 (-) Transcript_4473:146-436(-)